ncbi:uncharacterized protein [Dendropsophus ebraccatus]|uniref:uncharacterized protein n=1 Tax=Dendropsophus ebraccatus TaxID=150705 RepID=UPI003831B333
MRNRSLNIMRTMLLLCLLCSLLCYSFAFDRCIQANSNNIIQGPRQLEVNSGEDAVFNCTLQGYHLKGANIRKRFKKILFVGRNGNHMETDYLDRLSLSGDLKHFSVTLKNLTVDDSDLYLCDALTVMNDEICGYGTLLIVHLPAAKDKDTENKEMAKTCSQDLSAHIACLIIIAVLFVCCMALCVYMKHKGSNEKLNLNHSTYVDMTQTLRRDTMGNSYMYNRPPTFDHTYAHVRGPSTDCGP